MTKEELLKLVDAGFTASEIRLMARADEAPKEEPKEAPKAEAKEEPKAEAKEEPKADPVLAAIEKLTGAVQAMNMRNNVFGEMTSQPSADDVLRAVYYPDSVRNGVIIGGDI